MVVWLDGPVTIDHVGKAGYELGCFVFESGCRH